MPVGVTTNTGTLDTIPASEVDNSPAPVSTTTNPQTGSNITDQPSSSEINTNPVVQPVYQYPTGPSGSTPYDDNGNLNPGWTLDENNNPVYVGGSFVEPATQASADASRTQALKDQATQQAALSAQQSQPSQGDWRVRLQLAPNANYLYKDPTATTGILAPLAATNGIIFPYTPEISTAYRASYSPYTLTHSNYRGYFYENSYTDQVILKASFTAQDTNEANYVLAVIHFFRSATKMFYGQDAQAGSPPPLVFLSGLGEFQFNKHPCLVTQFNYTLPAGVDYIRARSPNQVNLDLNPLRPKQTVAGVGGNDFFGSINRLAAAFTTKGALPPKAAAPNLGLKSPTYVPTKIDISLVLYPVQSRQKVSNEFSLQGYANGDLLKGGFW